MKLKYKKIILLTTMSTMGIGILTLSVSHDNTDAKESNSSQVITEYALDQDTAVEDLTVLDNASSLNAILTPTPLPTSAPSPTPTSLPVYKIVQEGTYPAIDKLINDYYTAKNNRDVDALKALFTDPAGVDTQEELQAKTEYIDKYLNIKTYTKKGFKENTYIVYAYSEIKFTSINTPAPGLAKFYVVVGEDNKPKIFSGDMDEETLKYYTDRNNDEDVVALIDMTNKKSDDAKKSDEDLYNFWKNIKQIMESSSADTSTKGGTN